MSIATNELRKDYLLDRWVVIATQRRKRPTDFAKAQEKRQEGVCALCPGNEHMTPPAVLVYLPEKGGIRKDKDENGLCHKNWLVRVVSNLYPAFTPPEKEEIKIEKSDFTLLRATGHHEVLVESPRHNEHLGVARISQAVHVVNAYIDRLRNLSSKPYVKYVSIFRNHGLEAGASLSHAHTQLIATPFIPKAIEEELKASKDRFKKKAKRCVFCEIVEKERRGVRFLWENNDFTIFAPWASIHPFEYWIFPKEHQCCLLDLSKAQVGSLAEALRVSLGGLNSILNDPPYNFGFHQIASGESEYFHWHLEVYPRLAIWAGFEKSTGMFINVVSPEDAAKHLQETMLEEEKKI